MSEIIFDQSQKFYLEKERVNNEQIFHQIGTIIENDQEYFVKINPVEGEGFALFGLYNFYLICKYIVEFKIYHTDEQIDKTHLNSPVAIVDISINAGEKVLARKEVKLKDLLFKEKTRFFSRYTICNRA
jgi:hypothetical protein